MTDDTTLTAHCFAGWRTVSALMHRLRHFWLPACLAAGFLAADHGLASPISYWRHEEGPDGAVIAAGDDTVLDATGNGNHMRTFDPSFTSATYSSSVSPLTLRSGLPNTLSLDFGPGGDDPGLNDDNYTAGKPINSHVFGAMTVELAFNMNSIGGFQALLGKDGMPTAGPVPPLKVMVRGDDFPNAVPNQLFVEWIDGDGDVHFLASGATVTAGTWNHAAFVVTASEAQLFVASETGPYTLLDSISGEDFAGASGEVLFDSDASYTVGRGAFGGGIADWADARIDELRISDMALSETEFLFIPVPEPTAAALLIGVLGGLALRFRRPWLGVKRR